MYRFVLFISIRSNGRCVNGFMRCFYLFRQNEVSFCTTSIQAAVDYLDAYNCRRVSSGSYVRFRLSKICRRKFVETSFAHLQTNVKYQSKIVHKRCFS